MFSSENAVDTERPSHLTGITAGDVDNLGLIDLEHESTRDADVGEHGHVDDVRSSRLGDGVEVDTVPRVEANLHDTWPEKCQHFKKT